MGRYGAGTTLALAQVDCQIAVTPLRKEPRVPTYEYRCDNCATDFDFVQSFTDDPLTECPTCGSPVRKVFGSVGIVFKGSGFYKTDSRSGGSSGASTTVPGESAPSTSTESGTSDKDSSGKDSGGKDSVPVGKDSSGKDSGGKSDKGSTPAPAKPSPTPSTGGPSAPSNSSRPTN
jgi:putative FmdB family regulatory protein